MATSLLKNTLTMQENKHGVERLLRAIEQNIDDSNINALAALLNYHEPQLKQDIEAIANVTVINKSEVPEE